MPRFDLSRTPILEERDQEVANTAEILTDIKETMLKMGLHEYPRPANVPKPLCDVEVESLTNDQLGALYASYTSYAAYISSKLAEAQVSYKISSSNSKQITARLKAQEFTKGTPKAEVPAVVAASPAFRQHELEHLKLYAIMTILEAHYGAFSKQAATLSRLIEIRKLELEQSQRDHNVGGIRTRSVGSLQRRQGARG